MGHKHDYWERIRGWLLPKLGLVAQYLHDITGHKLYVEGETHNNQFVGRVAMPEEEFEEVLHDMGFERNPLSAWKHLEGNPNEFEENSFRKVGYEHAPRMQLHVITYDGDHISTAQNKHTYIYAHWEYRWDTDPWKHYRKVDASGPIGVRRMKSLLGEYDIPFDLIRP